MLSRVLIVALALALAGIGLAFAWPSGGPPAPGEAAGAAPGRATADAMAATAAMALAPARVELPVPGRDLAMVRARILLPEDVLFGSLWCRLDETVHRLSQRPEVLVGPLAAAPGQHRLLVGWALPGPRLQVVDVAFDVEAGTDRDLGTLAPAVAPTSWLRVELDPALAAAGGEGSRAEAAELAIGISRVRVPLAESVPIDGLVATGIEVLASARSARQALEGAAALLPARQVTVVLGDAAPLQLEVVAYWPPQAGWLECNAVGDDAVAWSRVAGNGIAHAVFEVDRSARLLVASMVDRGGATRAFALRELQPAAARRVEVTLAATVAVRGEWSTGGEGATVRIALAAWPERDLWRAPLGADGTFAVPGLPAGVPLLLRRGDALPRSVEVREVDGQWRLVEAR